MIKIVKSLAIIVGVVAIAGGATYAYLNDTAAINGSTFSAGTMDLRIDKNPASDIYAWSDGFTINSSYASYLGTTYENLLQRFGLSNLKPGDTKHQVIDIINVGGIDGYATIKFDKITDSDLANNLNFTVYFKGDHDAADWGNSIASGPLSAWNGTYTLGEITDQSADYGGTTGKVASVKIEWSVPTSAENNIMGDSVVVNTTFGLEQKR